MKKPKERIEVTAEDLKRARELKKDVFAVAVARWAKAKKEELKNDKQR